MEVGRLGQQMQFLMEIDKLKSVYRQNYLADGSRRENDAEHSWHLGMQVVVLAEYFPGIDVLKALKMVLIHDLVEVDAGDTFAYDEQGYLDKDAREQAAAKRIFGLLPPDQGGEMAVLWAEFEAMETPEAICAAVVDRLQPLTLNFAAQGRMWGERGIVADQVRKRNQIVFERGPVSLADYVRQLIDEATTKKYFSDKRDKEPRT